MSSYTTLFKILDEFDETITIKYALTCKKLLEKYCLHRISFWSSAEKEYIIRTKHVQTIVKIKTSNWHNRVIVRNFDLQSCLLQV